MIAINGGGGQFLKSKWVASLTVVVADKSDTLVPAVVQTSKTLRTANNKTLGSDQHRLALVVLTGQKPSVQPARAEQPLFVPNNRIQFVISAKTSGSDDASCQRNGSVINRVAAQPGQFCHRVRQYR